MDSEEEIMSESEEYGFENSSGESFTSLQCTGDSQTMTQIYEQPLNHLLRHGNLVLEDPTSSEKSWTDEKHSLYLNSIEEAFVSSLYHGYYTYPCKRLQADRGVAVSVFSTDLNEEVESAYTEDSQSESETPPNVQNDSKKGRLKDIRCSNEAFQERDINVVSYHKHPLTIMSGREEKEEEITARNRSARQGRNQTCHGRSFICEA